MAHKSTWVIASLSLLLLILFRTFISGWGPPANTPAEPSILFGLAAFPADNLSYVAWAEQAKRGRLAFENLYTTTQHERLLFNPLFLLVGKLASLLSASPLFILNLLATIALPVVILSVSRICRELDLGSPETAAVICLAIGGGGVSWIRKGVEWSGLSRALPVGPTGPDLWYYDVYPVIAYFVAPYHILSLAIVAVLAWMIVRFDNPMRGLTTHGLVLLACFAILLATVRPHIAIVVLAAYCASAAISVMIQLPRAMLIRRLFIAVYLAATILPPFFYAAWVSLQPVWSDFAMAHPPDTHDWTIGFFLLWAFAIAGVGVLGDRLWRSPYAFLACWGLISGVLLLVLNGFIYPKLTYGCTIALALLGGAAIEGIRERMQSRIASGVAIAAIAVLALASPIIMMRQFVNAQGTRVPAELFQVINTIHADAAEPFPTVLTDNGTGVLLPGLAGTRVFCGHWALTEKNKQKIVLLSRLGFRAKGESVPSFPGVVDADIATEGASLHDQIIGSMFQYLVIRKKHEIYQHFQTMESRCKLQDGLEYAVFTMCPAVQLRLIEIVEATMDELRRESQQGSASRPRAEHRRIALQKKVPGILRGSPEFASE